MHKASANDWLCSSYESGSESDNDKDNDESNE